MTQSTHDKYFRRLGALTSGPELDVSERMTNGLGWKEPPPAEAGGSATLYPWRKPMAGLPRFLREKTDWNGIGAPGLVIARLSELQRAKLRHLAVYEPAGDAPLRLEGSYPQLESLFLRVDRDLDLEEAPPRLWSFTFATKQRPTLAPRWLRDCRLEHVAVSYPSKVDWLDITPAEHVKFVALQNAIGSASALSRFERATDVHINQARALKSLEPLRPMHGLRELSLYNLAALDDLDALRDAEKLRRLSIYSCKDHNGAIRSAVEALRKRGVLVKCELTKSKGKALEVDDF